MSVRTFNHPRLDGAPPRIRLSSLAPLESSCWELELAAPRTAGQMTELLNARPARPLQDNPFFEPPFLPAAFDWAGPDKVRVVTLWEGVGEDRRLQLYFPFVRDRVGLTGNVIWRSWSHPYAPLGVPIVGGGENLRSMAYVDNICQGLLLCERVEAAAGRTYWIADRRPYTSNEIVDTVERVLRDDFGFEVSGKRLRLPSFVSELAWLADKGLQSVTLYHQKIHVLSEMNKHIACRIDRAEKELGYDPKIELEEGMRRSVQWCLDRGIAL